MSYQVDSVPKTASLGPYPDVSLSEAREKLAELKASLRNGIDPMAEKRKDRSAHRGVSLGEAAETYWADRKDVTDDYRENAQSAITMHLSDLLNRPIGSIDLCRPVGFVATLGRYG